MDYYTGAKGGCYTYNKNAKKRYVDPSFCRDKSGYQLKAVHAGWGLQPRPKRLDISIAFET